MRVVSPNISSDELMTSWDLQHAENAFANTIRYLKTTRYKDKNHFRKLNLLAEG